MIDTFLYLAFWGLLLLCLLPVMGGVSQNKPLLTLGQRVAHIFEKSNKLLGDCVVWAVLGMAIIQFSIVIMRYIFGVNFIWLQELVIYFFAASFMLYAGQALLADAHVRVDVFYKGATVRTKALIDFLGTYLFLFPVCTLIVLTGRSYVARSWAIMEHSTESSGLHAVFILKSLIPLFATSMMMAGFCMAMRAVLVLLAQPEKRKSIGQ